MLTIYLLSQSSEIKRLLQNSKLAPNLSITNLSSNYCQLLNSSESGLDYSLLGASERFFSCAHREHAWDTIKPLCNVITLTNVQLSILFINMERLGYK